MEKYIKPIDTYVIYDHYTHGRIKSRYIEIYDDLYQIDDEWKMIKRFVKVTSKVTKNGKTTIKTRWYVSDLAEDTKTLLCIIRSYWKIENSLHYVKDVAYFEDFDRTRTGQIPYVKTMLRNFSI